LISQEGTTYQVDFYITFVKGYSCAETVEQKKSISERRIGINMSSRTNPVARPRQFVLSRIYFVLFKACEENKFIWATSIAAHSELKRGQVRWSARSLGTSGLTQRYQTRGRSSSAVSVIDRSRRGLKCHGEVFDGTLQATMMLNESGIL
jgi:hypothetical protein